jgi:hypothetical protein
MCLQSICLFVFDIVFPDLCWIWILCVPIWQPLIGPSFSPWHLLISDLRCIWILCVPIWQSLIGPSFSPWHLLISALRSSISSWMRRSTSNTKGCCPKLTDTHSSALRRGTKKLSGPRLAYPLQLSASVCLSSSYGAARCWHAKARRESRHSTQRGWKHGVRPHWPCACANLWDSKTVVRLRRPVGLQNCATPSARNHTHLWSPMVGSSRSWGCPRWKATPRC